MKMVPADTDTIVALASGSGEAGVAVIRLSGPEALAVGERLFRTRAGRVAEARRLVLGEVVAADGELLDKAMLVRMPGPGSFTGEDVVEIHCHGSQAVVAAIIDAAQAAGARLAKPGEFSQRAFLNGRMDLAQAESLADLIASRSAAARRVALRQLSGGLSERVQLAYDLLVDAVAEIEAHLDFPDEDIPGMAQERILGRMDEAVGIIQGLLSGYRAGRVARDGVRVVLAGRPNAGKSSLFNALLRRERAIVSPHAGTTRDTLEAVVDIGGIAVTLVDTAGLRSEGAGEIEVLGIKRSRQEIEQAGLVVLVEDATEPDGTAGDAEVPGEVDVVVLTKGDIVDEEVLARRVAERAAAGGARVIAMSSVTGQGLPELEEALARLAGLTATEEESALVSRLRHAEALEAAQEAVARGREAFEAGQSGEFVALELREALVDLGEITGERLSEQVLDKIFSTFCLGK